jgi:hypothetical protein
MKNTTLLLVLVVLAAFISSLTAFAATEEKDRKKCCAMVDKVIAKYEIKANLINSRSINLREDAIQSTRKAVYFKSHKNEIIDGIMLTVLI